MQVNSGGKSPSWEASSAVALAWRWSSCAFCVSRPSGQQWLACALVWLPAEKVGKLTPVVGLDWVSSRSPEDPSGGTDLREDPEGLWWRWVSGVFGGGLLSLSWVSPGWLTRAFYQGAALPRHLGLVMWGQTAEAAREFVVPFKYKIEEQEIIWRQGNNVCRDYDRKWSWEVGSWEVSHIPTSWEVMWETCC